MEAWLQLSVIWERSCHFGFLFLAFLGACAGAFPQNMDEVFYFENFGLMR